MIIFPVLILLIIIVVRFSNGMFAAFLVLVATKSIMDAFWDIRVGPLSFSSIGGILIPILFYSVVFKIKHLPKAWVSNAKLLFIAYSFGLLFAFTIKPIASFEVFIMNINIFMGFLLIPLLVTNKSQFQKLLIAIIISGIFPIVVSVFQYQAGIIFNERQTAGLTRYVGFYHDAFPVRFYGLFTFFSCILYLSVFKRINKFLMLVLVGISMSALFSVYLVFSKAAVVIICLWIMLMLTFSKAKLKYLFIISIFTVLAYVNFGDVIYNNIEQLFSKEVGYNDGTYTDVRYTLAGRGYIWDNLWDFWLNEQIPLFQWTGDGISRPAHNQFLKVLLSSGIIGVLLFVIFLFKVFKLIMRSSKKIRLFLLMLFGMFLIDCLGLTTGDYYYYNILTWGLIGYFMFNYQSHFTES